MNIIILGVRIIKDSDNRGSDNRGCTVCDPFGGNVHQRADTYESLVIPLTYEKLKQSVLSILLAQVLSRVILKNLFTPCTRFHE